MVRVLCLGFVALAAAMFGASPRAGVGPMPASQADTQTGSDTLATSTPASAIGPTRPWFRNTHLVRGAIASNRARVVVLGDSLMNITTPSGGYKSGATMLMQVGTFGHIRAFQAGGGDVGNMPVRISPVSPGTSGVLIGLHHDTAKSVTAAPDAPEYVGLPVHCNGMRIDAPLWSPPSGVLATVTLSLPWLAEAVHPAWSPADAQGVGCRLLQYTPAGAPAVDAPCTVRDSQWYGTVRAACNPSDGLSGNPPIPGQINPVAPDVLLTADAGGGAKSAVIVANQPVGSAGYLLLVDPIFYHANDNGAGAPARVPGNYVQVLARLSWARWNFSRDTVPTATFTKSDTDARYNRFFQITTLDAGHQPVIVVRVDTEYSETPGGFPELGPTATMCTRADYRAALEALMARMDDVFATIPGSPAPIYWFQQPVHHWSGLPGFGAGPASSKNDAINADRHNRLLEAMHDVCAVPGSRAAYTSLFAFFQARLPHPNPTVDPVVRSVLDSAFGANWVPPGTSYAPYTPGTGGDGGALLDSLGIHTKNAGAERIMAWICKHSVDVDPSPCPGDANGDGVTNSQDFVVFALAYGRPAGAASARLDFNTDGVVDAQDLRPLVDDLGCGE